MWVAGIVGDIQAPYHDPRAVAVAAQILADAKLDLLLINGDWWDARVLGRYPALNNDNALLAEARWELKAAKGLLKEFLAKVKPKQTRWHDGNHEFRISRVGENDPRVLQLISLDKKIVAALGIPSLFEFDKLKIDYVGPYPNGSWLHPKLEPHQNVWVEHGYRASKKAGYTVSNTMLERMASCIVNHCEKLAGPLWTRALDRDFFAIENGNLSIIAETDRNHELDNKIIYRGIPHSVPKYLNHRQGFSIVYYEHGQWWPFCIKIRDGEAMFNGKLYKA